MKIPEKPPAFLGRPPSQALLKLFITPTPAVTAFLARANGDYMHWEKLLHRPPPEGLSAVDAWQLLKFSRFSKQVVPQFRDVDGHPFAFGLPATAAEQLHDVDRQCGTLLGVSTDNAATALGPARDQILVTSLIEEAIATSQIEGAVTTRQVAQELLRSQRRPRDRSERMIVNSFETMQFLRNRLDVPLSIDLLFDIQERMTSETLDDPSAVRRFRTEADDIAVVNAGDNSVLYVPPPAALLQERLQLLVDFANADARGAAFIHPLVKAAILHFWLAYEHPYVDGNGRTARALFYWFMLKSGYWLFEFLTVSRVIAGLRNQYYRSFLYTETDDGDLTYSIVYQLKATLRALASLHRKLESKQEEQKELSEILRAFPDLNYRQREVVGVALRKADTSFTFQSHALSQNITVLTARNDLLGLLELELLRDVRDGNRRVFFAPQDLAKRLRASAPKKNKQRSA